MEILIYQGASSPTSGITGNAGMLVRGKTVDGSSTTVDLNISQVIFNQWNLVIEIQESV